MREGGVVGVDDDLGQQGRQALAVEVVAELLFEEVADHAFGLRVEDVEGVGGHRLVGGVLQGEEPDLGAVAVGEHDLVVPGYRGNGLSRDLDVGSLYGGVHELTPPEQGVATEGDDDAHHPTTGAP